MPSLPLPELPDRVPHAALGSPPPVRWVTALEASCAADRLSAALRPLSAPTSREPLRTALLGGGLGHALHPVLTDLALGLWTSTGVLDLLGGQRSRPAARLLLGCGVVAAVPTALTGLAEWGETPSPESRVGAVHAGLNGIALTGYAASWLLRRAGRHGAALTASSVSTAVVSLSAYLGGHLATARKVGSRDAAFLADSVGPVLSRPDGS